MRWVEEQDYHWLQEDIDKFHNWSKEWETKFRMKKLKYMDLGKYQRDLAEII